MSALAAILRRESVTIATDTLSHFYLEKEGLTDQSSIYSPNIFAVPQFKSVVANTGQRNLGNLFFLFASNLCIGQDVTAITELNPRFFIDTASSLYEGPLWGRIFVYGWDNEKDLFRGFWADVDSRSKKTTDWTELSHCEPGNFSICLIPEIEYWYDRIEERIEPDQYTDHLAVLEMMKFQQEEDMKAPDNKQCGIGGEILITRMGFNNEDSFLIISEVAYKFPVVSQRVQNLIQKKQAYLVSLGQQSSINKAQEVKSNWASSVFGLHSN